MSEPQEADPNYDSPELQMPRDPATIASLAAFGIRVIDITQPPKLAEASEVRESGSEFGCQAASFFMGLKTPVKASDEELGTFGINLIEMLRELKDVSADPDNRIDFGGLKIRIPKPA